MSQNTLGANNSRNHRYRRYREMLKHRLGPLLDDIPRANRHRCLLVTRQYAGRQRRFDHGNLVGGCKPLLDVLVSYGVLVNDTDQCVTTWYTQERTKVPGLVLQIDEVDYGG